jgi:hypothetical protein
MTGETSGEIRPGAECGRGRRDAELDPRRSAEEESGMRNSTRGGARKRNAGRGISIRGGVQKRNPDSDRRATRASASRCSPQSISRFVCSPRHSAFLFRTPPRVEFLIPDSSSALRLGSSSGSRIPLPHSALVGSRHYQLDRFCLWNRPIAEQLAEWCNGGM